MAIASFAAAQNLVTDSDLFNFHFQQTIVTQGHLSFHADYSGPHSLHPYCETATSITTTAFLGLNLLNGLNVYFNPELSGGTGISSAIGLAGYSNGETYRISDPKPVIYPARLFITYTINLDQEMTEEIKDDINQLPNKQSKNNLIIVAGKFSILDFFDDNEFSHEPRTQFLNWAIWSSAAWDYPADTRGYTYGLTAMYNNPSWGAKIASIMEPKDPNGLNLDAHINKAFGLAFEADKFYSVSDLPGIARFLIFLNKSRMGNYQEALNNPIYNLDIVQTEAYSRTKYGLALNLSQKLSSSVGGFLRLSWNDGKNETWAFTEIDRAISCGIILDHPINGRNDDQFGIALAVNGISQDHKNYIAAGGLGFMIGDGKLNYGNEMILESFYKLQFSRYISISPDYQLIINPAYNKDRGPVHIFGIRVHTEF